MISLPEVHPLYHTIILPDNDSTPAQLFLKPSQSPYSYHNSDTSPADCHESGSPLETPILHIGHIVPVYARHWPDNKYLIMWASITT